MMTEPLQTGRLQGLGLAWVEAGQTTARLVGLWDLSVDRTTPNAPCTGGTVQEFQAHEKGLFRNMYAKVPYRTVSMNPTLFRLFVIMKFCPSVPLEMHNDHYLRLADAPLIGPRIEGESDLSMPSLTIPKTVHSTMGLAWQ